MQTLSHIPKPGTTGPDPPNLGKGRIVDANGKIMQMYEDSHGLGFLQSLTEVATPSMRSSQGVDADLAFNNNVTKVQEALQRVVNDLGQAETTVALRPDHAGSENAVQSVTMGNDSNDDNLLPRIRHIIDHVADYPETKRNHERRLDQLENASFSNDAVEELRDQNDQLDIRITDLEGRMGHVENAQMLPDASSINDSIVTRTSSALIASAIDRIDSSRIEALEAQIAELQAIAPPSHSRPWEVEVVFLPFGPRLLGIWSAQHSMTQLSRMNSMSGDERTQTQNNSIAAAQARLTAHDHAIDWENSVADLSDQDAPWLMAKACGVGQRVDERLRSRGLVKTIQVTGPDARDVQAAMLAAFGDLPTTLAEDPYSHRDHKITVPHSLSQYLGLRAPWIPLRKLHKNSCLRFLNTSEMITPALWTVHFLSSSVAMRSSGVRRLYVTQPDSYIQHLSPTASWTWQKLRQLDRVYSESSFNHTPEADANEPCWETDNRLDPPPSLNSSIVSQSLTIRPVSREEIEPSSPSDHFSSAAISRQISTTPTSLPLPLGRQFSPLKERHPFRPIHTRTTSMPSLIPIKTSSSQPTKRRIGSFEHEPRSSPTPGPSALSLKRRRTRSPSRPLDTPRWSVGPPSPYTYVEDFKRGTTPFAYATPHSNAPYIERHLSGDMIDDESDPERGSPTDNSSIGGGERNALSDYEEEAVDGADDHGHQVEDEWEGVQDEEARESFGSSGFAVSLRHDGQAEELDRESDSCPSEYPSTQQPHDQSKEAFSSGSRDGETKAGFRIHVDEEVESVE